MSVLGPLVNWMEATSLAGTIRESSRITGALSACHLIGLTLIAGGAVVSNLARFGVLGETETEHGAEATRPVARAMTVGLSISVATGLLLLAPRASTAVANSTFQLKMSLLAVAALLHFTLQRANRATPPVNGVLRAGGALELVLWFGVALAGCAYILLE
jgi:hypothetical protein